jgi:thioredoxin 1
MRILLACLLSAVAVVAAEDNIHAVTSPQQFDALIAGQGDKIVVVDFWAEWCGPCKILKPILHDLAVEHPDKLVLLTVDVDGNGPLLDRLKEVEQFPTIQFYRGGKLVKQHMGMATKEEVLAWAGL